MNESQNNYAKWKNPESLLKKSNNNKHYMILFI